MAKETILYGEVKFREKSISEDLTARLLGIDSNGNLVDRPAVSSGLGTSLSDGRVWIGSAGSAATAVDTASVGDIDADSVNGLTIKAGVIVNADINGSAAIAYSKLNLSNAVVNADVAAGAGIVYSKLSLTNSIVNADVAAAAAITRTKLATGTAYRLVVNDASGIISENASIGGSRALVSDANGQPIHSTTTAAEIAFVSGLNAAVQTQLDNEIATKTVKAIVKAPTVAEHGYAITWDNATGQWDLTDPVVQGIPLGGNTRQSLVKIDATDWNAEWTDLVLTDITDISALANDLNLLAGLAADGLTTVELSYSKGVTSDIQSQLAGKLANSLTHNHLFVGNVSNIPTALATGTDGQVLASVSGVPTWQTVSASGVTTIGAIDGVSKAANGGTISGATLHFQTADATSPGLVSTGAQTFAGVKTFSTPLTAASAPGTITSIGGLSAATQLLAVGTSGTDVAWSSVTATHTLNIPSASATARGVITTGSQTIAGAKTLTSNLTIGGSTYSTATTGAVITNDNASSYIRIGRMAMGRSSTGNGVVGENITPTTTGNVYNYASTAVATMIDFTSGNIVFRVAPSGTIGNPITFTNAVTIVNATGNVGIGVSPGEKLHVFRGSSNGNIAQFEGGASSFSTFINHDGSNSTFSTNTTRGFVFSPNSTAALYVANGGSVGIGAAPTYDLDLQVATADLRVLSTGTGDATIHLQRSGGTASTWKAYLPSGSTNLRFYNGSDRFTFDATGVGTATDWVATSDRRVKRNIERIGESVIEEVKSIGALFSRYEKAGKTERGFIAQELLEVAPEYVVVPENSEEMMAVNYSKMTALLFKGFQQLLER